MRARFDGIWKVASAGLFLSLGILWSHGQSGSLQVTINPYGAVSAGARWRVDGGAFQYSGATVADLSAGSHTVSFTSPSGWIKPPDQLVMVYPYQTTYASGTYTVAPTGVQVGISPPGAIAAGARWQVDGGAWQSSGASVTGLSSGSHTITFLAVIGWMPPGPQTVSITAGNIASVNGVYQQVSFSPGSPMTTPRAAHTATLLPNGNVLISGGTAGTGTALASTELYDSASGIWTLASPMSAARQSHTATLLADGTLLVAGGRNAESVLQMAELHDPVTGTWSSAGGLLQPRGAHTAVALINGKVLLAGGTTNEFNSLANVELYDPATRIWTAANPLLEPRSCHTATPLSDGKVLVVGGRRDGAALTSAEIFDPATGNWATTSSLSQARWGHTATLLPDGRVLVVGGTFDNYTGFSTAECYDPALGTWASAGAMAMARFHHTSTLLPDGRVVVVGGRSDAGNVSVSETYNPSTGTWAATGTLVTPRSGHTTVLLPGGKILLCGGTGQAGSLAGAEWLNLAIGQFAMTGAPATGRWHHTATMLPSLKVLLAGGSSSTAAELYDPATRTFTTTGSMNIGREDHRATLLPNGKVLVSGGDDGFSAYRSSAELYDPATATWTVTGSMNDSRTCHTATLLPSGKVLVAGGYTTGTYLFSAELYDPVTGTWTPTGSLISKREFHTATLLRNGKVLVAGGEGAGNLAELYDPGTGMWAATGKLNAWRIWHSATLLPNGKVLVAGGASGGVSTLTSAEIYDPETGSWALVSPLATSRSLHIATLLGNGKVLVAGGFNGGRTAEFYDPAADTWTPTGLLNINSRYSYTATLLADGNVLLVGGAGSAPAGSAELYDPGLGFAASSRPGISFCPAALALGEGLTIAGTGFHAVSGASGGNTQDSSSGYPLLQLRNLDTEQSTFLPLKSWSSTSLTSGPVVGVRPGHSLATVFVNGVPSVSACFLVSSSQPPAVVTLGNLIHTYNGSAKRASVSTSPPGLAVNLTYNGSPDAPTNVGSYTVVGTLSDPNYQGSTTNTLAILIPDNSTNVIAAQSATIAAGQSAVASTAPDTAGQAGVAGQASNAGGGTLMLVVANYATQPSDSPAFYLGANYFDIRVWGADASDALSVDFYYPSTLTAAEEASLMLRYWDGLLWQPVLGAGGSTVIKDTTDNLDGTLSGGRFRALFGADSNPSLVSGFTGTVFAFAPVRLALEPPVLSLLPALSTAGLQLRFTSMPGAAFSAFCTTNLSLPPDHWTFLGIVNDSPAGQFHFTDTQATNAVHRFYRVRSP